MEYNEQKQERVILAGVHRGMRDALWDTTEESIHELGELVKTAGGIVVGEMIQNKADLESATYMGEGKLDELKIAIETLNADMVVFDDELSPVQMRNISDFLEIKVLDRSMLILDIFAGRARSSEGKLQVELAQLKYSLPRLSGKGTALSRLGGGIGTRGPGETKLETDRRHIRFRIQNLKAELDKVEKRRVAMHQRRKKNGALCVAIVGYTNAGKSTLMNRLTDAGVLQEDKLFATLDPTARKLVLPDGRQIMLVDTVGLVRRLPHQLVDAFRSTLEEAVWADVILNVCDASSDECAEHIGVTESVLSDLGCSGKPIINVLNKCDKPTELDFDFFENSVKISAATGDGIDSLLTAIENALPKDRKRVKILLPFDKMKLSSIVRDGTVHSEEYTENGVLYDATVNISDIKQLKDYII